MQLCRIIYYSYLIIIITWLLYIFRATLSLIHQEHLNCSYSFWFYSRVSLSAAVMAE